MSGRVLVVEDDPVTLRLMQARLDKEYFQVVTATSGKEAYMALATQVIDVVLLDIILPDTSGFEICRQIKANPKLSHIPVVITTTLTSADDRLRGLEAGADEFISKPANEALLIARVKNLVRVKQAFDELRARSSEAPNAGTGIFNLEHAQKIKGRVLIIEDQFSRAQEMAYMLSHFSEVEVELDPSSAAFTAAEGNFDVVMVSFSLTNLDGLRICSQLRTLESLRSTPILAMTDDEKVEDRVVRALEIGVNDYVKVPADPAELRARIGTQIARKRQSDWMKESLQSELEMAILDPLTGLHNRRYLDRRLPDLLEESKQDKKDISLLIIDIDRFKSINDSYGHEVGDKILVEVSRRMSALLRQKDVLCRYGGEEFVVVLPDCSPRVTRRAAERLRNCVEHSPFLSRTFGNKINMTVSIGIATSEGRNHNHTFETFLRRADRALYAAKSEGRNRVVADAA